jgi:hypothetical protein
MRGIPCSPISFPGYRVSKLKIAIHSGSTKELLERRETPSSLTGFPGFAAIGTESVARCPPTGFLGIFDCRRRSTDGPFSMILLSLYQTLRQKDHRVPPMRYGDTLTIHIDFSIRRSLIVPSPIS